MQRNKRTWWTGMAAGLLTISLAACGNSATGTTTGSAATSMASTPTVAVVSAAPSTAAATAAATTAPASSTAVNAAPSAAAATTVSGSTTVGSASAKLNLNTATEQQLLAAIPNFPSRMVREFMEYRPYVSIAQFRKEIGKYVSAEDITAWEQYVYVPVDPNTSDAATLQQLPGVDAILAANLVAGRAYASNDAFLAKLASSVSADQVALAKTYLAAQ